LFHDSICSWEKLEHKFCDHFYSSDNKLKLSDLTSIRQGRDESVHDNNRRFRDTKNQYLNLTIGEKDLANLAFNGLCSYIGEKFDNRHTFITLAQLQQRSLAQESRTKEPEDNLRPICRNVEYVDYDSDSSSDESNDICVA
jgi:hypothetical protein